MIDFTSLFYAVVFGFGLFGMDAVWNANTVQTDFMVSDSAAWQGIKPEFAETVFTRELQEVFTTHSLIRAPEVRSSHEKTFVTILAESVGLDNATAAFQDLFGIQPVAIIATLATVSGNTTLEVVGEAGGKGSFFMSIPALPGEGTIELIRRGAIESAFRLDVYHTALHLLDPDTGDPNTARAIQALDKAIAALPPTPQSTQRARLRNLRGIAALLEDDKDGAAAHLEAAVSDDPTLVPAVLNLAFLRVEQDRYADALQIAQAVLRAPKFFIGAAMTAGAHTIAGVSHWALRNPRAAEVEFAAAVAADPHVSDAYIYWGRMLTEMGRLSEGRDKLRRGAENLAEFENYPEVALLYFWMTEKDNVPLERRPRGAPI